MNTILIIEDDPELTEMYQAQFSMQEYAVLTASDGAEGIERATDERPDVILLDILMPNVNGFEVLKKLKESPETKNIPVVVYTNLGSNDSDEKRELAFSLGAADYLIKALHEPNTILDRINSLLKPAEKSEEEEAN